jgi:hypothetical protein
MGPGAKPLEARKGVNSMQNEVEQKHCVSMTSWRSPYIQGGKSRGAIACLLKNFKANLQYSGISILFSTLELWKDSENGASSRQDAQAFVGNSQ